MKRPAKRNSAPCILRTRCGCMRLLLWDPEDPEIVLPLAPTRQGLDQDFRLYYDPHDLPKSLETRRFKNWYETEKVLGQTCHLFIEEGVWG